MAQLEVNQLSIALPRDGRWQWVVNQVSFDLAAGRVTGLVGESGSGKSLTARALLGLVPRVAQQTGALILDGQAMHEWPEKIWRRHRGRELAMVFQDPLLALNPLRTIGSQMNEVLRRHQPLPRAQRHSHLAEALQRVHLSQAAWVLQAYPHQLSGGMRQRVMIAMALLGRPRVLIADEPTAALDPTTRSGVLSELLRARADTGCAMLLISHDLALVEDLCDDVLIMYAGRILERGAVNQVLHRPRHPYSATLMAARPRLEAGQAGRLPVIPGQFSGADRDLPGCVFAARCPYRSDLCVQRRPPWSPLAVTATEPTHGSVPGFACHHPMTSS